MHLNLDMVIRWQPTIMLVYIRMYCTENQIIVIAITWFISQCHYGHYHFLIVTYKCLLHTRIGSQCIRTKFHDPYLFVQSQGELCYLEGKNSSPSLGISYIPEQKSLNIVTRYVTGTHHSVCYILWMAIRLKKHQRMNA